MRAGRCHCNRLGSERAILLAGEVLSVVTDPGLIEVNHANSAMALRLRLIWAASCRGPSKWSKAESTRFPAFLSLSQSPNFLDILDPLAIIMSSAGASSSKPKAATAAPTTLVNAKKSAAILLEKAASQNQEKVLVRCMGLMDKLLVHLVFFLDFSCC